MIIDKETLFAQNTAVTNAAVVGGTVVDLVKTGKHYKLPGFLVVLIKEAFAGGTALEFQLVVADDPLLTVNSTVISSTGAIPLASLGNGAMFVLPLPINFSRRYVGVKAVPTGQFVAGKFDAFITMDVPQWY